MSDTTAEGGSWQAALKDAEAELERVELQRRRLQASIRMIKALIKDGRPWPTGAAEVKALR